MRYDTFTVRVPESEFLRYPKASVSDALAAAAPRLPALRRALIRARDDLLLGAGTAPSPPTSPPAAAPTLYCSRRARRSAHATPRH